MFKGRTLGGVFVSRQSGECLCAELAAKALDEIKEHREA